VSENPTTFSRKYFKKALQSSFWVENGALWELRLLNLNVIDIDLFVHFSWVFW
jgi:hypothetical protein